MAKTPVVMVQKVIGMRLCEAAHVAHVLLAGEGVDDGAGGEEEQGLEEGVGDRWKMAAE